MKEGYKLTVIGEIPEEWTIEPLGQVAEIEMGQSPSSSSYNEIGVGMYLVQGNADIKNRKTSPRIWTSEPAKTCEVGDVIMTVRAPVGAIAKSLHNACIGRGVCAIRPKKVETEYLYQYLIYCEPSWNVLEQGSTFTAVNSKDVKGLKLPIPQKNEQKKIAEILSTVDEKIDVIDAQITQTQELKKGIMQQLLTKGIGHTQFKASPLGDIPKNWTVKKAKEITNVEYGISEAVSQNKDSNIGIPIITGANITLDGKLNFEKRSYIKQKLGANFELKKGDILFNWRSGSTNHVGKTAIFNLVSSHTYASFILRLRVFPNELNNKFFNYQIQYLKSKEYFTKDISIQVNFKINANVFREIQFLVPPLDEQNRIATILLGFDDKINLLNEKKSLFIQLKKGLMQQLLTGKIRVNQTNQTNATLKPRSVQSTVEC